MKLRLRNALGLAKVSLRKWGKDGAPSMGAALAFYTLLSMAPLMVVVLAVTSLAIGRDAAEVLVFTQLSGLLGEAGAEGVRSVLDAADQDKEGWIATAIGLFVLLLGATTVFAELKKDLDRIWDYRPKVHKGGILKFLRHRLISFGLLLAVGFLLLVSLAVSSVVAALNDHLTGGIASKLVVHVVEFASSFAIITLLFAVIYKVLPSCKIAWGDVWVGAAVTSMLFVIGKTLIGIYLGKSAVASSYGAAGTLVAAIVWVYYNAQIFFLGAEFTRAFAERHGSRSPEEARGAGHEAREEPRASPALAPRASRLEPS